ncbi:MAG: XdhC/CoxI family protein [Candidatus Sumerlaeota bacterium]|nr:XdhC/CoxI family protein [Candidatus Sumerlaeota bacterium]
MSSRIIEAAAALLKAGKRGAMVTIIETTGSTPRRAGAKMLVDESGRVTGTVGGGCLEADLCALARDCMRTGRIVIREMDLSAQNANEYDMLCGGELKVLIEPLKTDEKLFILGGGHISRALVDICRALDFHITVTDDRPQFANAERFPAAHAVLAAPFEEQFAQLPIDANSFVVIVTRGHNHDKYCLEEAIKSSACYIAMVGSRTKMSVFRADLIAKGVPESQIDRVHCPAGLDIGAETPEEIAISIAAQIVTKRHSDNPPQ